jgi:Tol biopolymer transport system component
MLTAALLLAPSAGAGTWPGQNGRIAYEYAGTIWTINPDGTDAQELVTHPDGGGDPSWSPDGDWVAFESERDSQLDLYVIRADGTGEKQVTNNAAVKERFPSWVNASKLIFKASDSTHGDPSDRNLVTVVVGDTPSGTYTKVRGPQEEGDNSLAYPEVSKSGALTFTEWHTPEINKRKTAIWTAAGGGTPGMVSTNNQTANNSGWSPDGGKVVYSEAFGSFNLDIFTNNPTGGAPVNVTQTPSRYEFNPRYSPDGTKIVFDANDDLYVVDAAGGNETMLPTGFFDSREADWGIIPGTTPDPPDPDSSACDSARAALKKANGQVRKQLKKVKKAKKKVKQSSGKKKRATRKLRIRLGRKQRATKVFRNEKKKLKKKACSG